MSEERRRLRDRWLAHDNQLARQFARELVMSEVVMAALPSDLSLYAYASDAPTASLRPYACYRLVGISRWDGAPPDGYAVQGKINGGDWHIVEGPWLWSNGPFAALRNVKGPTHAPHTNLQ